MGWDELTNSTLPDSVVIFGWQGYGQAALKAARQGHRFVMTPARVLYLIRYQGPQWFEPRTYFGNNTLADVYNYNPVAADWTPEMSDLLLGIQGSLWTEFCESPADVEHQLFPRLAALAEAAWIAPDRKDWPRFLTGLDRVVEQWNAMGIHSARSMYNIDHLALSGADSVRVALSCIRPDVTIRFTIDGAEPTFASAPYVDTLRFGDSHTLRAATFGPDGTRLGEVLVLPIGFNKATGKQVIAEPSADRLYTLTNGVRGSDKHSDFEWAGWYDTDFALTLDLGAIEPVRNVSVGTVTNYGMGIVNPASLELYASTDGEHFTRLARREMTPAQVFPLGIALHEHRFDDLMIDARYLRLVVANPGACPEGHVRPDLKTWVYLDELTVE
jgi:hexosaminidase